MPFPQSRIPFSVENPYRPVRPATSRIIFLSLEGSVTEEEYFERVSDIYSEIRSRIQFISVAEDAVHTKPKFRTAEQAKMLSKARPKQLVERIEQFILEKNDIYQFSQYPDEWNEAISVCEEKGYGYAVSNPFFEIWLLLHHDVPNEEDKAFAVTDMHEYEKTAHFRERLRELHAPLRSDKHIELTDYDDEKIRMAVRRAEDLHVNKQDLCPRYFATTVYLLLRKIMDMLPEVRE